MPRKISILLTLAILVSTVAYAEDKTSDTKSTPPATAQKTLPAKAKAPIVTKTPAPAAKTRSPKQSLYSTGKNTDSQQLTFQKFQNESNQKVIDEKLDSFEKRVDDLKWTISTVLMIMGGVFGFFMWKYDRQYREAKKDLEKTINEAKKLAKEAGNACNNAKVFEQEAQAVFERVDEAFKGKIAEFDKAFGEKLGELEERTKEHVKDIYNKTARQQELSKQQWKQLGSWNKAIRAGEDSDFGLANSLWAEATQEDPSDDWAFCAWGAALSSWAEQGGDKAKYRYHLACEKYLKATELNPNSHTAFYNWGVALMGMAKLEDPDKEELLKLACEKYKKATELKADSFKAFYNWGFVLLRLAKISSTHEIEILEEAREKFEKAERIQEGSGAYGLGCTWARLGNEEKCMDWLLVGEKEATLVTREHAMKDEDLASVRDKAWFQQIRWKDEE